MGDGNRSIDIMDYTNLDEEVSQWDSDQGYQA